MKKIVDSKGNRLALGDHVCFTKEAIKESRADADEWDSLLRNVDPQEKWEVKGFDKRGGIFLKGWNIIRNEKALPISVNTRAVRKAF